MEMLAESETPEEVAARQENIDELINKIVSYEENSVDEKPSLSGFLEEVALIADIDNLDESVERVMLMTLHSSKGLEFPMVYITGLEDGLFPSYMTITSDDPSEVEEERRLCYVGITRAKKELSLSAAKMRMVHGETKAFKVSRFMKEVPEELINIANRGVGGKSKLSFGGEDNSGKLDIRSNARASMSRYSSSGMKSNPFGESSSNGNVGFGKAFPADIFDLEKSKSAGAVGDSSSHLLGYSVGDRVKHTKFGEGNVTLIVNGGRDFEVTVDFEKVGVKKMLVPNQCFIVCIYTYMR